MLESLFIDNLKPRNRPQASRAGGEMKGGSLFALEPASVAVCNHPHFTALACVSGLYRSLAARSIFGPKSARAFPYGPERASSQDSHSVCCNNICKRGFCIEVQSYCWGLFCRRCPTRGQERSEQRRPRARYCRKARRWPFRVAAFTGMSWLGFDSPATVCRAWGRPGESGPATSQR